MENEKIYESVWQDDLQLTPDAADLLMSISKWTRFLSVLGFIMLAFSVAVMLSAAILMLTTNNYLEITGGYYDFRTLSWTYLLVYLLMIAVYFVPVYLLYKFSVKARRALLDNDRNKLRDAFAFLKNHYMAVGILAIVAIIFYVICFLFMLFNFASFI